MPAPGKLGAGIALAAYAALVVGMAGIGIPAQRQSTIGGLWLTEAIAIALPALFVVSLAGIRPAPYLGFRPLSWKQALIAAGLAVANQPVVSFLTWIARSTLSAETVAEFDLKQQMIDAVFRTHAVPMFLVVTIAAPLGEETFFRGLAFPALRRTAGPVFAMVVSGALFSAIHVDQVGFLGLMEIGILLAALRLWTGSIWACVIGHAVNNGIAGAAFILGLQDPNEPSAPWFLALGAILLVAGIVVLARLLAKRSTSSDAEEIPGGPGRRGALLLGLPWLGALLWGVPVLLKAMRIAG